MKTICSISVLAAVLMPAALAQNANVSKMRDASTHEQLTLAYRKAAQADPMRNLAPAKGNDPSVVNQPKDLVANSDILCFGGNATLVPKHAILTIPKNLAERMKFLPGSRILSWTDFYTQNRGWITTVEVSRVQAEGNKALDEEVTKRIGKSMNLVVATYMGGPISVLPPKAPADKAPADKAPADKAPAEKSKDVPMQTAKIK